MSVKIILADDHKIVREGVRGILANQKDFTVIAEADNGRTAVSLALELHPDVVVIDISMPDLNGMDATRRILAADPRIRVVALSVHSDKRFVANMFAAGARGYLRKDCAGEELIQAIRDYVHAMEKQQAVGLFYFAGHGVQLDWRNYMVPVDAKLNSAGDVAKQTVDVNSVIDAFKAAANSARQITRQVA